MIQVYSDVIQFKGTHYDFGYMQGELLRNSPILVNREKQWASKRKRHFSIDKKEAIHLLSTYIPGMLDEIEGVADALHWDMDDALREFGGYYLEYGKSGCSILTNAGFMVRNYDSHPGGYEGRYVAFQPTDSGYATVGPSMQITGRIDGINEKGLAMGYNFINRIRSGDGFICNMVGRIILETCATVEEAIDLLKQIPHRISFSYVLLDSKGESYVVEATPRSVVARKSSISTNHFEMLTEENRYRMDDSIRRQQVLTEQISNDTDVIKAFQLFNDPTKHVFAEKYDNASGTIHTSAYIPEKRKAWFSLGGNQMPIIIDLNQFLKGKKIPIKRMKGKLHYTVPFINEG